MLLRFSCAHILSRLPTDIILGKSCFLNLHSSPMTHVQFISASTPITTQLCSAGYFIDYIHSGYFQDQSILWTSAILCVYLGKLDMWCSRPPFEEREHEVGLTISGISAVVAVKSGAEFKETPCLRVRPWLELLAEFCVSQLTVASRPPSTRQLRGDDGPCPNVPWVLGSVAPTEATAPRPYSLDGHQQRQVLLGGEVEGGSGG